MASTSRISPPALIARLLERPEGFDFIQAVRLLNRLQHLPDGIAVPDSAEAQHGKAGIGEASCFVSNTTLHYPTAAVVRAQFVPETRRIQLTSGLFGLIGAMGVLPYSYTDLALQSLAARNPGYTAFLDLFHNRATTLFWQASTKYRIAIAHERAHCEAPAQEKTGEQAAAQDDDFTHVLRAMAGLSAVSTRNRLSVPDLSILYLASLFASNVRSMMGLEQLLSHHLERPVRVEPFVGGWLPVHEGEQTRLAPPDSPAAAYALLGQTTMLGAQAWVAQDAFRIVIGPVDSQILPALLPDGDILRQVRDLTRLYCGIEYDFDINVIVKAESVPASRLATSAEPTPLTRLGYTSWLLSAPSPEDRADAMIPASDLENETAG
ncbi:type VI secretion system baseplate subunit TssG [Xanthobacter sp. TB0139]|uniref:type VI secretion system baseplate subunit TssG n=1 Tax=Xanthobacter sp. TB0139 TaxID=3459178 RepID=UPI00403A519A